VSEHAEHCEHCAHHHELQVSGLTVRYRAHTALEDATFETSCGNCVALIGPNGAGKSTLLKAIAGLIPRAAGSISWRGTRVHKWHREFAYLPQREEVDWSFPVTVRGLVEMGRYSQLGWWKRWRAVDDRNVASAMALMHLEGLENRQISELSGGQQQRAFIARAIASESHVLLLDEPFTGLDRPARENLSSLLRRLASEGRLVIASHHDLNTVTELFDQVLILNRRPVAFGNVANTFVPALLDKAYGTAAAAETSNSKHQTSEKSQASNLIPS
jgi:ABC-type Mn2+/Zn2+ transport system ATPase subunit